MIQLMPPRCYRRVAAAAVTLVTVARRIQHVDERVYDVATTIKSRSVNPHNVPHNRPFGLQTHYNCARAFAEAGFSHPPAQMECMDLCDNNSHTKTQLNASQRNCQRNSKVLLVYLHICRRSLLAHALFSPTQTTQTDTAKTCPQTTAREKQQPTTTTTVHPM